MKSVLFTLTSDEGRKLTNDTTRSQMNSILAPLLRGIRQVSALGEQMLELHGQNCINLEIQK